MDIILENDPLMPNLHPKLKANHGMDTMATPAITVTDITTDVKTHKWTDLCSRTKLVT